MTVQQVALPMYLGAPDAVQAIWSHLRTALHAHGLRDLPDAVVWPTDLHAHWLAPNLLLSQTCGYPLTHALQGKVQLLGCFRYKAPGCEGINCRSVLIARTEHASFNLENFRNRRVAFNSSDSQSGYNALRALVAPLAKQGCFFNDAIVTGGHRQSVDAVRDGQADLAAIDCVTWALLQKTTPQATQGLREIGFSAPYPGLPLITSITTAPEQLQVLRAGLQGIFSLSTATGALDHLLIGGFETPTLATYQPCVTMQENAAKSGYFYLC